MKRLIGLLLLALGACYGTPEVEGFDATRWQEAVVCDSYLLEGARILVEKQASLLGSSQNEIENLLGQSQINQLDNRNQKVFYYPLTQDCGPNQLLELRFDALGRLQEINLVLQ